MHREAICSSLSQEVRKLEHRIGGLSALNHHAKLPNPWLPPHVTEAKYTAHMPTLSQPQRHDQAER